ncbi:MAG: helix-turn-helix transcriptional regulator [Clostridia bacterium]|nr:helix-turn-helix transcriptional regulator [Clostridia bacterium]
MLKIKEFRLEEGWTQKELAEKIGAAWYNVGDWERGKAEPSVRDLIRLAEAFGCSVDELIGRSSASPFENGMRLSREEETLLMQYRELDEEGKGFLLGCAGFASSRKGK